MTPTTRAVGSVATAVILGTSVYFAGVYPCTPQGDGIPTPFEAYFYLSSPSQRFQRVYGTCGAVGNNVPHNQLLLHDKHRHHAEHA